MLSEQLKMIRKANGFTQVELAKAVNIERSTYASYETGRNRPDVSVLEKIAVALGVTVDFIINLDTSKSVNLSDGNKNYNEKPKLLSELSSEEKEIIARLRLEPEKVKKVSQILFGDDKK
jgi:transcriptional regulator with XRE-family HTH domain